MLNPVRAVSFASAVGFALLAGGAAPVVVPGDATTLAVTTSVTPAGATPGSSAQQTARVINTGDAAAALVVLSASLDPGCQWRFPVLLPGQSRSATCSGTVAPGVTLLTATATGRTRAGAPLQASASTPLAAPPQARAAPDPPRPTPRPEPAAGATLPPPDPAARRRAPPAPPQAGAPAAIPPPAAAALPAIPLSVTPSVQSARPALRRGSPLLVREQGPLARPVRSAAIVAVLGVFVMTVSVGALSAAIRVR